MTEEEREAMVNATSLKAAIQAAAEARIVNRFEILAPPEGDALLTFGSVVQGGFTYAGKSEDIAFASMHIAFPINRAFAALLCNRLVDHFKLTPEEVAKGNAP